MLIFMHCKYLISEDIESVQLLETHGECEFHCVVLGTNAHFSLLSALIRREVNLVDKITIFIKVTGSVASTCQEINSDCCCFCLTHAEDVPLIIHDVSSSLYLPRCRWRLRRSI